MDENFEKDWNKAKEISDVVMEFSRGLVRKGARVLDIADSIEQKILSMGAKPAWPVNISINEIAAHYTPVANDTLVLDENDLVKMDIGVQINGLAVDRAYTVCIGKKKHPMIEASQKAVDETLKILKPGVKVCELSEVMENTVKEFGFNTIRNLCGHAIERNEQHALPSIPNAKNTNQTKIKEGQLIAIEVFVTDGIGWVMDSGQELIFKHVADRPVRMWEARQLLEIAKKDFDRLPFAKRWIKDVPIMKLDLAINELLDNGSLHGYSPLKEQSNAPVAVTEETKFVK